jgi:hypothetical protein
MLDLPAAARLGCWLNAWIAGRASADAAITGITGGTAKASFSGLLSEPAASLPPALLLGEVRRHGVARASVALPLPGDLVGLGGPSAFNLDAVDAGQAVLLVGTGLGLVPSVGRTTTTWVASAANPPTHLPDVASADRELKQHLLAAADCLAALDVAAWSPDAADAVLNLSAPMAYDEVMFGSAVAARLVTSGLRCTEIVRVALRDDGGSLTAASSTRRREALLPLRRAALSAIVTGCSSVDGR